MPMPLSATHRLCDFLSEASVAQKDFLVGIERVGDDVEEPADLGLKAELLFGHGDLVNFIMLGWWYRPVAVRPRRNRA
jgi:hypothetical protein